MQAMKAATILEPDENLTDDDIIAVAVELARRRALWREARKIGHAAEKAEWESEGRGDHISSSFGFSYAVDRRAAELTGFPDPWDSFINYAAIFQEFIARQGGWNPESIAPIVEEWNKGG